MKYLIKRRFSFRNKNFDIFRDSKLFCTAQAVSGKKEQKRQYNVKILNPLSKYTGESSCVTEIDTSSSQKYLLYLDNDKTGDRSLFGQLSYRFCGDIGNVYTIIIRGKQYSISSDCLKYRRFCIVDTTQSTASFDNLCEVNEVICRATKSYHVTIYDQEDECGYLALIILLYLHERQLRWL